MGKDSCLSAKDHSIAHPGMVADAYLAAEDGIVTNGARAGDAGLRGDDGIAPDLDIVANVHEVVDLGAASDMRLIERTAIDSELAPISTSSSMTSVPCCGNWTYSPVA